MLGMVHACLPCVLQLDCGTCCWYDAAIAGDTVLLLNRVIDTLI